MLWLSMMHLPPSDLDCRKWNPAAWLLERERCIYSSRQSLIAQWTWEQWFNCDKLEVGSKWGIKLYAFWICKHKGTTAEPVKNTKQEINFWSMCNRIKNFFNGWIYANFNITSILKELFSPLFSQVVPSCFTNFLCQWLRMNYSKKSF